MPKPSLLPAMHKLSCRSHDPIRTLSRDQSRLTRANTVCFNQTSPRVFTMMHLPRSVELAPKIGPALSSNPSARWFYSAGYASGMAR